VAMDKASASENKISKHHSATKKARIICLKLSWFY